MMTVYSYTVIYWYLSGIPYRLALPRPTGSAFGATGAVTFLIQILVGRVGALTYSGVAISAPKSSTYSANIPCCWI